MKIKAFNFLFILPVLSSILLAAHFSRGGNDWFAGACSLLPLVLLSKKQWVMRVFQLFLITGGVIWLERTIFLIKLRQRLNMPWTRLAVILGAVTLFTFLSALVFNNRKIRAIFKKGEPEALRPAIVSSLLTAALLIFVRWKVKVPVMLLADRFFPGSGLVEILLLTLYAGWITEKVIDPKRTAKIRARIWVLFSVVFFIQLTLGVAGIEKLLMTGKLHLPVPAMIVAGPLFRGGGLFMLILFVSTVLLVGPAWCSYLCYIGAWDNVAARNKKVPQSPPKWRHAVRIGIAVLVVVSALLLRIAGVPGIAATIAGAMFGLIGVGIMVFISRKMGVMTHCIVWCPIGLAANWLGRINPFRLRITDTCTDCGACRMACNYEALNVEDIKRRKPAITCTLCGDCVSKCHADSIQYRFLGLKPKTARYAFIVLVVSLHAVFLGVARL
jgi:ferredoxin